MSKGFPVWPVHNLVIFDCDSTLSSVEGIDELARLSGREHDVAVLTKRAMEGDVPLESVYGHRLGVTQPTQAQVRKIARLYRKTVVTGAREVIEALQNLGCQVFIVSGGLIEPVRDFGVWLGVLRENIFAVDMEYDQLAGSWWRYWEQYGDRDPRNYMSYEPSPLAGAGGKRRVIARLRESRPGRALLVGDGGSDLEAASEVDLFVGFGGVEFRQLVAENASIYIRSSDLSPILPLALGSLGNTPRFARLWGEGFRQIRKGEVTFREPELAERFLASAGRAQIG